MNDTPEGTSTRRMLLKHSLVKVADTVDTAVLVLPAWILGTYANWQRIRGLQSPESVVVPNLGLKIDQKAGEQVYRAPFKYELLPDATKKENIACPAWSPQICMGFAGTTFRVAINRPVAEFMFKQANLTNPVLKTSIILTDNWADQELGIGEKHTGGYTVPSEDMSEQFILIYLRGLAWKAFKDLDEKKMAITTDNLTGVLSFFGSWWLAHELGHAGAESKHAIKNGTMNPKFPFDRVHDQVFRFQDQYTTFYNNAMQENKGQGALLVAIEASGDLVRLRDQIYQEAAEREIK